MRDEAMPAECLVAAADTGVIYPEDKPSRPICLFEVSRPGRPQTKTGEWMRFCTCLISASMAACLAFPGCSSYLIAQEDASAPKMASAEIPEAPQPAVPYGASQSGSDLAQSVPVQAPSSASQESSSSQTSPQSPGTEKSQRETAAEQLKQQEKQRVMGVMATFNTTTNRDAAPLSPGQKYHLFFKSATDPWPFLLAGVVAGIGQANNSNPEWGQGMEGYAKRFGAGYSDYFIGNFFGNAVLPSLFHEDPRYFQKGTGSAASRFLWAAGSTVWCRRDKGGFGPNYGNVLGNFIGVSIARLYYPAEDRTVSDTLTDGLTVTAEGIVGAEVIEFWPDLVRHHKRKKAEKLARQQAARDAQGAAQPASQSAPEATPKTP